VKIAPVSTAFASPGFAKRMGVLLRQNRIVLNMRRAGAKTKAPDFRPGLRNSLGQ
jgi:hypothetical protein